MFGLALTVFLGLGPAVWGNAGGSDYHTMIDEQEAIGIALAVTGLESSPQLQISAQSEIVATAQLWRVTFQNGPLVFFRSPEDGSRLKKGMHISEGGIIRANPRITRLDVIIDAASGQFLKITSPLPEDADPGTAAIGFQKERDAALYHSRVRIDGVSSESPRMSFLEALQYMAERGLLYVVRSGQVEATYLDVRDDEERAREALQTVASKCADLDLPIPTRLSRFPDSGGRGTVWLVVFQYVQRECCFVVLNEAPLLGNFVPNPILRSWTFIEAPSGRCIYSTPSQAYIDVDELAHELCR